MSHPSARALAGLLAAGMLLAGCSSDPDPVATTSPSEKPSTSAEGVASASASPSSTLTPEEQQAFEEATKVVLAYRQTITDLYSGARTNLNDLNRVAAGELRDKGLKNIQQSLTDGWRRQPEGVELVLVSAEPVELDLAEDPNTVVVRACIDATGVTIVDPEWSPHLGHQGANCDYHVTRTAYLPDPGWAVTQVSARQSMTPKNANADSRLDGWHPESGGFPGSRGCLCGRCRRHAS